MSKNTSAAFSVSREIPFEAPLPLENGWNLPRFDLMVGTYGILNAEKSNAVPICHALLGSHHVAGRYPAEGKYPDWQDSMVGPGKPTDTERSFVVGSSSLGGCHGSTDPLSQNPEIGWDYSMDFPLVMVKGWAKPQALLADYLGIRQQAAVISDSLGGMQTLQWVTSYPERVHHTLVTASVPELSTQNIVFDDIARQTILTDPDSDEGRYACQGEMPTRGLRIARMMGYIAYLIEDGLNGKFGRDLRLNSYQYGYDIEFEVEFYLRYQGGKFTGQSDVNTYLLMTKALDYFGPAADLGGNLTRAL